jgi:hypothetical protein
MEEEPKTPERQAVREERPPPFRPDLELVTTRERGRKDDAPEKFRKALAELSRRETEYLEPHRG